MRYGLRLIAVLSSFVLTVGATSAQSDFPDVLYLRFNEGIGISTVDAAIPGFGSVPFVTPTSATWDTQSPRLGNSAFNLSADCVTSAPISSPWNYTIEFWIRADSLPTVGSNYPILWGGPNSLSISANLTGIYPSATPSTLIIWSGGIVPPQFQTAAVGVLVPNVWNHFACVVNRTNGVVLTYVNGNRRKLRGVGTAQKDRACPSGTRTGAPGAWRGPLGPRSLRSHPRGRRISKSMDRILRFDTSDD